MLVISNIQSCGVAEVNNSINVHWLFNMNMNL